MDFPGKVERKSHAARGSRWSAISESVRASEIDDRRK